MFAHAADVHLRVLGGSPFLAQHATTSAVIDASGFREEELTHCRQIDPYLGKGVGQGSRQGEPVQ